ncbi:DUF397 domain-containing protein [Actinomadura sp. BRA 177]|uniref:DUF397 domain-containing protein n=1 Tax=Actinomadura sp. BRA 177 TaxID=2745202 RepID=UPI001595B5CF|nr:DUF397 domain-containing protein [Actinomadura sp. BRA 177]NVI90427.1 DUF397 domain-containing protein [Actinomadura sp. BRA 177]
MDLTAVNWRKSSLSGNNGGQCVEVAVARGRDCGAANKVDEEFVVLVRDSKNPEREPQVFTVAEWDAFLDGVRLREFDSARLIEEFTAPVR